MQFGFYDWITLLALLIVVAAFTVVFVWLITLPGRIAINRHHPHAEAVKLMGNLGFLGAVPWFHALLWACFAAMAIPMVLGNPPIYDFLKQRMLCHVPQRE